MNLAPPGPPGALVVATTSSLSRLSRQAKSGKAMRLAPGLYAVGATLPPEQVAKHHIFSIVAAYWPEGVLCGRSALAGGQAVDGVLYVAHSDPPRATTLRLPGLTIEPVIGPGKLPGDRELPGGLALSGPARVLVENTDTRGARPRYRAGTAAVEDRIDELARSGGADRIRTVLSQLDVISGSFDPSPVNAVRHRLVAVLGTYVPGGPATSGRLAAGLAGAPYDSYRMEMIEGLVAILGAHPPRPRPAAPPVSHWAWSAFFEAYFSNFIEGTEFGVDEARRIAVEGVIPQSRPADAHDVSATYRLAIDPADRVLTPTTGSELLEILQNRHRILMAARPDKRPGDLKLQANFAGGYQFVEPALVRGTLERGFDVVDQLHGPLARAVAMMALVTEVHPFDDGNGRVARLTSNAELSRAGEVRIVIPNVYRDDYLAALSGMSNGAGHGESLVAVLDFAQKWTAAVDWSTYNGADATLAACNAYLDPGVADRTGRRFALPAP